MKISTCRPIPRHHDFRKSNRAHFDVQRCSWSVKNSDLCHTANRGTQQIAIRTRCQSTCVCVCVRVYVCVSYLLPCAYIERASDTLSGNQPWKAARTRAIAHMPTHAIRNSISSQLTLSRIDTNTYTNTHIDIKIEIHMRFSPADPTTIALKETHTWTQTQRQT